MRRLSAEPTRCSSSRRFLYLACSLALLISPSSTTAQATWCDGLPLGAKPNIILIIMDDLGWSSLPVFSPPSDDPRNSPAPLKSRALHYSPTANRLDARLFALPNGDGTLGTLGCAEATLPPFIQPAPCVAPEFMVKASDSAGPYNTTACEDGVCDATKDALPGFGGLARLAAQGTVFTRAYAASAVCLPTRAALLTGTSPAQNGSAGNGGDNRLRKNTLTIPKLLRTHAGYYTGLIGKWHITEEFVPEKPAPANRSCPGQDLDDCDGFDEAIYYDSPFRGYAEKGRYPCRGPCCRRSCRGAVPTPAPGCTAWQLYSCDFKGDDSDSCWDMLGASNEPEPAHEKGCIHSVRAYADMAAEFIERNATQPKPFFLEVAFTAVHDGHSAPKRSTGHYDGSGATKTPAYWALIEETDAAIGRILDKLADEEIENETIVIFTADQGPDGPHMDIGDPSLRGDKEEVYDGGIREPLIVRACEQTIGQTTDQLVSHVDVFRTLVEAAFPQGVPAVTQALLDGQSNRVRGVSFYPTIRSTAPPTETRDVAFAQMGNTVAMVSKRGYAFPNTKEQPNPLSPIHVCGFEAPAPEHGVVRAGSRKVCLPQAPNPCAGEKCTVLGSRCIPKNMFPGGQPPPKGTLYDVPDPESYPRCYPNDRRTSKDCATTEYCLELETVCTECMPAQLKVRSTTKDINPGLVCREDAEMYDLTTNPEEQANLDFLRVGESNLNPRIKAARWAFADWFEDWKRKVSPILGEDPPSLDGDVPAGCSTW